MDADFKISCLEMAIKAGVTQPEKVVKAAEAFYAFVTGPAPLKPERKPRRG